MGSNFAPPDMNDLSNENGFSGYMSNNLTSADGPLRTSSAVTTGTPQFTATSFTVSDILQGNFIGTDQSDSLLLLNKALTQNLSELYTQTPAGNFSLLGSGEFIRPLNEQRTGTGTTPGGGLPSAGGTPGTSPGSTGLWTASGKFAPNTAGAMIVKGMTQLGKPYKAAEDPNHGVDRSGNPNPPGFDCSGFVYWSSTQSGYSPPTDMAERLKGQPGWAGWWAHSQGMIAMLNGYGTTMPVTTAVQTAGALLLKYASSTPGAPANAPTTGHVAISLGNGWIIESTAYKADGVNAKVSINRADRTTWHMGGYLPGMRLGPALRNMTVGDGKGGAGPSSGYLTGGGWNGYMGDWSIDFQAAYVGTAVEPTEQSSGGTSPGIPGTTSDPEIPLAMPFIPPAGIGVIENGRSGTTYVYGCAKGFKDSRVDKLIPDNQPKMPAPDVAKVFYKYGGWRGNDLIYMVAIALRESVGGYCHVIVKRPATGDYSFGLLGINMIDDLGPARAKSFGITNYYELCNPIVAARAGRAMWDSAKNSASFHNDPYWGWGRYKKENRNKTIEEILGASAVATATQAVKDAGLYGK